MKKINELYLNTPMLEIDVKGIIQPKLVGAMEENFIYTMAKKGDVGMQVIVQTNLDFFGIAKTLILKSVKTDDTNIISYTDYVFNFYPLEELPSSPKSGQIVYEVVPPVEYQAMKPYYSNSTVTCSL